MHILLPGTFYACLTFFNGLNEEDFGFVPQDRAVPDRELIPDVIEIDATLVHALDSLVVSLGEEDDDHRCMVGNYSFFEIVDGCHYLLETVQI